MNTIDQKHSVTLYGLTPFDRSGKARWLLAEMGITHEDKWLNHETKEHEGEAYLRVNPLGRVPAMVINERPIFESGAICAYLADLHLNKGFAPALNSTDRLDYQQWMYFSAATLDTFQTRIMIIEDIPPGDVFKDKETALLSEAKDAFELLNQKLAKNDYLVGNRFGAADISISYPLYFAKLWPEFDTILQTCPNVLRYLKRLSERPAAIKANVFSYPE